ncbi:AER276Cp [Eremothecium gossypii ATCC 10895]|uniref:AER276Cp n=1 Tax=Eremothecium gossypii (strain ATCC 10895 / CBS 109.51 / FGSC 9923 / NRRL Y-1056) TaxID=284811 RepID=Q756I5_EREGS|nr:AER276Cp [Eremothecium gossypii ATCC 10895]AAS52957.1 AER276Cp [Eremothecium gossypii ATCC 10895]
MVVIVASLFLPFQPQFEISTSRTEAAALVDSQVVKIPALGGPAESANVVLKAKRASSSHGLTSPFVGPTEQNSGSDDVTDASKTGARGGISSQLLMENITSNVNSAAGTPGAQLGNHGNTSVEEFFASGGTARARDADPGSEVYSTASSPAGESSSSVQPGAVLNNADSTANLLKNVNKKLLYQSVLAGSLSTSALEGHKSTTSSNAHSTVITPRSRQLPDVASSVTNVPKGKAMRQMPVRRLLHRKSSSSIATVHSNLKYPLNINDYDEESVEEEGGRQSSLPHMPYKEAEEQESSDEEELDLDENGNRKNAVPKFGGYSNTARIRAQLMMNSQNIFKTAPWKIVPSSKGNGGLKNALTTALVEKTIEQPVTWIGTVGIPTDAVPPDVLKGITEQLDEAFDSKAVITDDITFKSAYQNFCKKILWPTLNYQIPDNPNSKAFEDHSWNYYQHLNQQFADKIVESYKDGDLVWVHDYHLMLVPEMVRKKLPTAKIGFFLHVSFPSSEVFRCFAQREKILEGILGAHSIGFQTEEYARHFQQTANRLLMCDVADRILRYKGRIIAIESTPIGVDAFDLEVQLKSQETLEWRRLIRERWAGKKLIVSRDQFDRIRGLRKKMLAYERFLKLNPEYIDRVVLIQVCLGSGRDSEMEREVMTVVDRINALSRDISVSQPVVFLHQDLQFPQYLALNCEADMFLVSTMREGMNLTCHEFVICSQEKNAPLLLSEFTGSARVLGSGSLLINPWDIRQVADTIKVGLELSKEQRRRKWKQMFKSVIMHDSDNWMASSLASINNSWEANRERSKVFNLSLDKILDSYETARRHIFILKLSEPPTARMVTVLSELCTRSAVFIINSFSRSMLERLYCRVPNIGLIAENGAFVRLNGIWYNMVQDVSWKEDIIKVIEDKVERLPGSYYKVGETMIRFHTENAEDQDRVSNVVGDAITHVNTLFGDNGIHAYVHKNIVFVQQSGLSVQALRFLLNHYNSVDDTPGSTPAHSPAVSPVMTPVNSSLAMSPSTAASKTPSAATATASYFSNGRSTSRVEFVCVTGTSSPVLEPLFQSINELAKKGDLPYGYTVAYGDAITTYAKEHVEGSNELFGILDKLTFIGC